MIAIGKKQTLNVAKEDKSGYYLWCEERYEVFLPGLLAPDHLTVGQNIEVFVYLDGEGNELATANLPGVEVGDFACLKVKSVTPHGAFLDMGIPKDLLVPIKLQKYEMKEGEVHLVMILLEEETNRIYGTSKIGPYAVTENIPLRANQSAKIIPYHRSPLGYKVLIEKKYLGMVYHNEIFSDVIIGQEYQGSIKWVREDGQIDAYLHEVGYKGSDVDCDKILSVLESAGGRLNVCDKSPPAHIEKLLQMSKKAYKRAAGILYKKQKIRLGPDWIELVKSI